MRAPEPGKMPLAKPQSSLLAYNTEKKDNDSDHFFNPMSRMHNNSTISKRFQPGELESLNNNKKVKVKKVKLAQQGAPRMSTRVRISSFFGLFGSKPRESTTVNASGIIAPKKKKKKRTFFQRLFGRRKPKRKSKVRDDIMEVNDDKVETLDLTFNNEPIDPRQHMRNTANFLLPSNSLEGPDLVASEAADSEIIEIPDIEGSDKNSVNLFEVDKARQSTKHDSLWEAFPPQQEEPQPLKPSERREMISFVGNANMKELEPAKRATLKETTIPRKQKRMQSLLFLSQKDEALLEPEYDKGNTLKGEDLPRTPLPERVSKQSQQLLEQEGYGEAGSSVLTSNTFKRKTSRNNSILSSRNIEKSLSKAKTPVQSEGHQSENITLPPPPVKQGNTSGVWSVDDRVASVLASAATLKRKKKKDVQRTSPDRIHSVAKTEASGQQDDTELLGILASPQTALRKKGSFSSFKSFEANL